MGNEYKDWLRDQQEESNIRTPERISKVLSLINEGWNKVPDWRLGQLIENLKRYIDINDLFYIEDTKMEKYLKDFFDLENEMDTFYQIVPVDDGYTYIGYKDGKHIRCSKMEDMVDTSLIWKNENKCEKYLKENLDTTNYKVEKVWLNGEYYKFKTKDQETDND